MMRYSPYDWRERDMVGGAAALDFVNTVSHWTSAPVDRLDGARGFAEWAAVAGLLDEKDTARLKAGIAQDPNGSAKLYQEASELRAALWRIFSNTASGGEVRDDDLALLRDWRVRGEHHCRIVRDGDGFRRACTEEAPAFERALRMIVDSAEDLLLNGRLDRLHTCGGDECEWMFIDLSKNGRRRWCSMATCGNDMKVKKFRGKKKSVAA